MKQNNITYEPIVLATATHTKTGTIQRILGMSDASRTNY